MSDKVLFTGKSHNTNGKDGAAKSSDGLFDLKLPQPHPAAENLFSSAWSLCYMGAIELAAGKKKIKLPPQIAVDTEITLNLGDNGFFLRAKLDVNLPGVDRTTAQALLEEAHTICPYSKAVHGNIEVITNLV